MSKAVTLVENDIKSLQSPMETEMQKVIEHLEKEILKIRTGRAHSSLVEDVLVAAYGDNPVPLKSIAVIAAPEARLITIQPWDKNCLDPIIKAIHTAQLGLTPMSDGEFIRIRLPEMSSHRRAELVKTLGKMVEESKVAVRNIRKDFNNMIRDAKRDKTISENFHNRLMDVLQKVTDTFIDKIDAVNKRKESEITST